MINNEELISGLPFDALLVLSFGGPEGVADVRPFMENVTRGRGIPPERLDEVSEHYYYFDGVSPLNALNREIIAKLQEALPGLPIYFGNRNWHPFGTEAAADIARDGHRKVAVFATSAWGGYSGCRQYDEDIEAIRAELAAQQLPELTFTKLRQFFDHPLFISANARLVQESIAALGDGDFRLVFTAHSIPLAADNSSGTPADGPLYSSQVAEAARLIAAEVGISDYDLVWQSRSGAAHIPWLEPDIVDHAQALHERGVATMVVCPVGFISDHIEVVWDLDTELINAAKANGQQVIRVNTVGPTPEFTELVVELLAEHAGLAQPRKLGKVAGRGCTVDGAPCAADCCRPARRPTAS
ncbi:ferrochelatase [Corynebacterium sp. H128]|uniref:ferrochelatase n=1 Tax=Corynebacterium sp. H128 TaxID=3133427 RepID=UPI0030A1C0E6